LAQDGIVTGAIYALVALALVLAFTVTRVIFVPQGELLALGALSLASLQLGQVPGTAWLLLTASVLVVLVDAWSAWAERSPAALLRSVAWNLLLPALIVAAVVLLAPRKPPMWLQMLMTIGLVVPLGPMIYRLAFQPIASASTLVLMIVAIAVHFVLVGLGLVFFGAEGFRTTPIVDARFSLGAMSVSLQSIWVLLVAVVLIAALYLFFDQTLYGKALRATAVNRVGARLVGVSSALAGKLCFGLVAFMAVVSGILVSPLTTIYYDTGFLIGLKAFVAAIIGGLISYPVAALGALLVGLLESYSSFWASAFKEVIVFALIIPVLIWRSVTSHVIEDEQD
jgi:branched-chain amino acid transport system permease protein